MHMCHEAKAKDEKHIENGTHKLIIAKRHGNRSGQPLQLCHVSPAESLRCKGFGLKAAPAIACLLVASHLRGQNRMSMVIAPGVDKRAKCQ